MALGSALAVLALAGDVHAQFVEQPRAVRPDLKAPPPGTRVHVTSDQLRYDSRTGIAIATGRVLITYGNYVLVANQVVYDRRNDRLRADGEVRLREPGGNILEANVAELRNKFRDGFAEHLRLLLTNDATLTAQYAKRRDGYLTVYDRVTYTRCKHCVTMTGAPLWQIKSMEVTHNELEQRIYHRNATFEFLGVPVAWTPYLSHPDPTAKRASGFLIPQFSYSKVLGFGVETPYFWNLAPNYDITFRPRVYTEQGPLLRAEWRHRTRTGAYSVEAGGIYQFDRKSVPSPGDKRLRGFIKTDGAFRINRNWTWGWDATVTSDDTFLRRYDIDKRTELTSFGHLTGIDDRNYLTVRAYHFRGLLTTDANSTIPYIMPYVKHNYVFDDPVLGGELSIDSSVYSIHRKRQNSPYVTVNQGTDQTRLVSELGWRKRIVTDPGAVITPFARVRGDVYFTDNVPDPTVPGGVRGDEVTARVLPTAGADLRWPFIRTDSLGQHVFTPVAQVVTSVNETKASRIGNEDAIAINFGTSNLFLHDRFSGLDQFEGGTRANYGFLYSLLLDNGGFARFSFGQSYHFAGRNSFLSGSGLETNHSDFVTAIAIQPLENFRLTYQARFDENTFNIREQEASISADFGIFSGTVGYVDLDRSPFYGRITKQEQVWLSGNLEVDAGWSVFGAMRYDIANDRPVQHLIGFGYDCDCFRMKVYYRESFTSDGDVQRDKAVMLQFEFKTLGSTSVGSGL